MKPANKDTQALISALRNRWFTSRAEKELAAKALIEFSKQADRQAAEIVKLRLAAKRSTMLEARIEQALSEMRGKDEASAIIVSPAQVEMYARGAASYAGVPILIATGISGPLICTREALDAISRQAPELSLRRAQ